MKAGVFGQCASTARCLGVVAAMGMAIAPACGAHQAPRVALAKGSVDGNATDFFSPRRLAPLAASEQAAWQQYLANSERLSELDRAAIDAELRALGRATMTRAPYSRAFRVEERMTDEWFHAPAARDMARSMLSFQTPSGGWSKHVEYGGSRRQPGQSYYSENDGWQYIATIDNDSTTEQLRFLGRAYAAQSEPSYRDALVNGIDYLLQAQFPSGCWPQVFPLQGGYHDAATYNDGAIVNVLRLLGDVSSGQFPFVPADRQKLAAASVDRGVTCIVKSQVSVGGGLAVWAQQHDPVTFEPVPARSYELAGLTGRESAGVVAYLMSLPSPDERVIKAVHSAAFWFKSHEIFGYEYDSRGLSKVEGAGPLWARLYEIGTEKPIFSNRDGIKRYDWNELTDRRKGYAWYTKEPATVLAAYDTWAQAHPRKP